MNPIDNFVDLAKSRLSNHTREFQDTVDVLAALTTQLQEVEDDIQFHEATLWNIDASEGVLLDRIGDLIGQARQDSDDAEYRIFLKARVKANVSQGTREDYIGICNELWPTADGIDISEQLYLTSYIDIDMTMVDSEELLNRKFTILDVARPAGYRIMLHYRRASEANTAKFGVAGEFGKKFAMSIDRSRI